MVLSIENALSNYGIENPSITSSGMLYSRFGTEMALSKILKSQIVRISQVWTDSTGDLQIDGLCILIDGNVVTDVDEANNAILRKGGMDRIQKVELYFIQSKSHKNFSVHDFNHFSSGVQNFVTNRSTPIGVNPKIENWFKIWKLIEREIKLTRSQVKVVVNMLIIFGGENLENDSLLDQMNIFRQNLPVCSCVTQVKYKVFGVSDLLDIYGKLHSGNQRSTHVREDSSSGNPVRHHPSYHHGNEPSVETVKKSIRQCIHDPNGYVFLADLGDKISTGCPLKVYLARFPKHFQFDNRRLPAKVKIVGERYSPDNVEKDSLLGNSSVEQRNELRNTVSGVIESVDIRDFSGTIKTSDFGIIPFYFSDLKNPEQESELARGKLVRLETTQWRGSTKVKSNSLKVI